MERWGKRRRAFAGVLVAIACLFLGLVPGTALAQTTRADAVVLVNSASASYADFAEHVQPYLDNFGVPYDLLDVSTTAVGSTIGDYALIVVGHRELDTGDAYLDATEEGYLSSAVNAGTGLVVFDNDLSGDGVNPRYQFIDDVFTFGYGATTNGSDVSFPDPLSHYVTERHSVGETVTTGSMTLAGVTLPGDVTSLADTGTQPMVAVTTYGAGRALQWGSYDWMSHAVKGPIFGLDDLVWRGLVWAARKPFVMQGLPPFATIRVDDEFGDLAWLHTANTYGFKPWAGVFIDEYTTAEATDLSNLVNSGLATAAIHAFSTTDFFYFDHGSAADWPDPTVDANFTTGTAWHSDNNIPISKFVLGHYYELGTNVFGHLRDDWGVEFIGIPMVPGEVHASDVWLQQRPYRLYESGQANSADPFFYSDWMTIPGHPEFDGDFFNCFTEIRDVTGYEWYPSNDVTQSVNRGTEWLVRSMDSLVLPTLFTHGYEIYPITAVNWDAIMAGIATNIASYDPEFVTLDYACQYVRAMYESDISATDYDSGTRELTVDLSGTTDLDTRFYLFIEDAGTIRDMTVDVPTFTGSTQVLFTIPGELDSVVVTPDPATVIAGGTQQFTAQGYDADTNPIPDLDYVWAVINGGGSIDAEGLFTAGVTLGTYTNTVEASVGAISDTATADVIATTLDHFVFEPIGDPRYVDVPFLVTIHARDASENPVVTYTGAATLSDSTGTLTPTSTDPFSAGSWTGYVTVTQVATGDLITVQDGTESGTSNAFDTVAMPTCPCSIWAPTDVPDTLNVSDGRPIEVGVRFRTEASGYILGLRFYKGSLNTGTHTGHLWTNDGTMLAEATFIGETGSGWQEVLFASAVPVTEGTTYVASYYSPGGYFSQSDNYFHTSTDSPPLRALATGEDGPNGVYLYDSSGFPADYWTGHAPNYWIDVVYDITDEDATPPTVTVTSPVADETEVAVSSAVTATFSEPVQPATIVFELRDSLSALVPSLVSYDAPSRTATLTPDASLDQSELYTATVSGAKDLADNTMVGTETWSFTTTGPPPDEGPGGPILVVSDAANPFGRYLAEILRAEGFDYFNATDISNVDAAYLAGYDFVLLGEMSLTAGQVTTFSDWVTAGGKLVAMRPDKQLASLLGLTDQAATLGEGYVLVDTASAPGQGIVDVTMQYHGTADLYSLSGAQELATLYSDATTATTYPAVTLNAVGGSGGQAAAFTYDLARSVVYTRQGNPAWVGQERDGTPPIRSDDLFYGAASGDPQPDWVDLSKVAIPQADEQQRLLANLLLHVSGYPAPRFWYFPSGHKAVIVLTSDDHGCCAGTTSRFDYLAAYDLPACVLDDWECVRSSSYFYPSSALDDTTALGYHNQGFELGVHVNTGCNDFTPSSLDSQYASDLGLFRTYFPSLPDPDSERTHCVVWSDWIGQAATKITHGMGLDLNYYFWPPGWVLDTPGVFTGSAMPMRFADLDGTMLDVYQVTTQMTDESGQGYPFTPNTLLDRAVGAEGYYGAYAANIHTGSNTLAGHIVDSAQARDVPVVSGRQMLTWLRGRDGSSFSGLAWDGTNLDFTVTGGAGALNLRGMIPTQYGGNVLAGLTRGGSPVTFATETIKGVEYAIFPADDGVYQGTFASDTTPPVISSLNAAAFMDGTAVITWDTDEAADSLIQYGTALGTLDQSESDPAMVTGHSVTLSGLAGNTTYYYRVTSADAAANSDTEPPTGLDPASFLTPASACLADDTLADFTLGTPDAGIHLTEMDDGELVLDPTADAEFDGTGLPTGWSSFLWDPSGSVTVSGGTVAVEAARIHTTTFHGAGRSVEFEAYFRAIDRQHVGFGNTLNESPWVLFSTGNQDYNGNLRARVHDSYDLNLGTQYIGSWHRYRIDWLSDSVVFWIDGNQVASHPITIGGTMRPIASDSVLDGITLDLDWLRMTPYATGGIFESRVYDAGAASSWGTALWTGETPSGAALAISVRTGDTPDLSAMTYYPVQNNGDPVGGSTRYIQYRADLSTSDRDWSSVLEDITFTCEAGADTEAPIIRNLLATSDPSGTSATITWTTNEPADSLVEYDTDVTLDHSESDATFTAAHSIQLTGLTPGTTYFYRVTSSDPSAHTATEPVIGQPAASFTTLSSPCFTDDTFAELALGTPGADTYLAETDDGEVTLAPTEGAEFGGGSLPGGWSSTPWAGGGAATVAGGTVSADGTLVAPATLHGPGRVMESLAFLGGASYQHVGFADDFSGGTPFAIFSTSTTSTDLYARVHDGSSSSDVLIPGSWMGSWYRFRIEWTATSIAFYIDDSLVHTETGVTVTGNMRAMISDAQVGGATVDADWIRMTPYAASGSFTSRVHDAASYATWNEVTWASDEPATTSVAIWARTGDTPVPDGTWTGFAQIPSNGSSVGAVARYIQYRADLVSGDPDLSSVLEDISFHCVAGPDIFPPVITNVDAVPDPGGTTATITWDTNESADSLVEYGTDSAGLVASDYDGTLQTGHSITLTNLVPGRTYHYRVTSADALANAATDPEPPADPRQFDTPVPICQEETSFADFSSGSHAGTYSAETGDGEVILAPTEGAEFAGAALTTGWQSLEWIAGGYATVGGGVITLEAARTWTTATYGEGRSLEFVATFRGAPFQHVGFVADEDFSTPWAMFSTHSTGTGLYARVNTTGGSEDVSIGTGWLGASHLYRIDWTAAGFVFSIDGGVVQTTHYTVSPGLMRVVASDRPAVDGTELTVDWIRMDPYALSGTFESQVLDAGGPTDWGQIDWTSDEPAGTGLVMTLRTGDTATPDGSWSVWSAALSPGDPVGATSRYLQYRAVLSTTDDTLTPELQSVSLTCADACTPLAGDDTTCDLVDDDCDGLYDEDYVPTVTGCGKGQCAGNTGQLLCNEGVTLDTCDPFAGASGEVCDGVDNDCDGTLNLDEQDGDGDGQMSCEGDCDDGDEDRYLGNSEVCDGKDNDCNTTVDDGGGAALCDDGDPCSTGTCNGVAGCSQAASGSCGIEGYLYYYRDGSTGERSTKPVPGVDIDLSGDATGNATTDDTGYFDLGNLFGALTCETTDKYGSPRASDHNGAVTAYDASKAAQHAVEIITLTENQVLAGDVSGDGTVSSWDASQIARFAVQLEDHFQVGVATGSDWKFLRCDTAWPASCTPLETALHPSYTHTPLGGPVTDEFYGLLYGDISGSWVKPGTAGFGAIDEEEREAAERDQMIAATLPPAARFSAQREPRDEAARMSLSGWSVSVGPGQRREITLSLENADGVLSADLELSYDAEQITIVGARTAELSEGFSLLGNDLDGRYRISLYGIQPMQGSGSVLVVTVEAASAIRAVAPFVLSGQLNEGLIPLRTPTLKREEPRELDRDEGPRRLGPGEARGVGR